MLINGLHRLQIVNSPPVRHRSLQSPTAKRLINTIYKPWSKIQLCSRISLRTIQTTWQNRISASIQNYDRFGQPSFRMIIGFYGSGSMIMANRESKLQISSSAHQSFTIYRCSRKNETLHSELQSTRRACKGFYLIKREFISQLIQAKIEVKLPAYSSARENASLSPSNENLGFDLRLRLRPEGCDAGGKAKAPFQNSFANCLRHDELTMEYEWMRFMDYELYFE